AGTATAGGTTTAVLDRPVTAEPTSPAEGVTVLPAGSGNGDGTAPDDAADEATAQDAPVAEAEFPIEDYDELKVSEILPLLSQLEPEEIPVVRSREQSTKARATILNRLDQVERSSASGPAAEAEAVSEEPPPAPAPAKKTTAKRSTTKKAAATK